jgi:hypothetical protein
MSGSPADRFRGAATKRALGLTPPSTAGSEAQLTQSPSPTTDSAAPVHQAGAPTIRTHIVDPLTADLFTGSVALAEPEPASPPAPPRQKKQAKKDASPARRTRLPVYVPGAVHTRLAERTAESGETYTAVVLDAVSAHHGTLKTRYEARSTGLFVGSGRRRRTGRATTQIQLLLLPEDLETLTRLVAESGADNASVYVSDALDLFLDA